MAPGEEADGELLDDLILSDNGLRQLGAEGLISFSELIDGGDINGR